MALTPAALLTLTGCNQAEMERTVEANAVRANQLAIENGLERLSAMAPIPPAAIQARFGELCSDTYEEAHISSFKDNIPKPETRLNVVCEQWAAGKEIDAGHMKSAVDEIAHYTMDDGSKFDGTLPQNRKAIADFASVMSRTGYMAASAKP